MLIDAEIGDGGGAVGRGLSRSPTPGRGASTDSRVSAREWTEIPSSARKDLRGSKTKASEGAMDETSSDSISARGLASRIEKCGKAGFYSVVMMASVRS